MRQHHLLITSCFLLACGDSANGGTDPVPEEPFLPGNTVVRAEAYQLYPDGHEVTCSFTAHVEWNDREELSPTSFRLTGVMGGEAARRVTDADGAGLAFFADMAWPTSYGTVTGSDVVTFELAPGGSGSPFWDAFGHLPGSREGGQWGGPWTCLPFGGTSGGYVDTAYSALGSWVIESPFVQRP